MPSDSSAEPRRRAPDPGTTTGDAATLSGVTVRHGAIAALAGVDLSVTSGERVALVGPSGAGKSTLLSIVAGLVTPTEGSVTVLGSDLESLRGRRLRAHRTQVGIVSQQLHLPGSLRVIHNINAGRLGRRSTPRSLLSLIRPDGIEEAEEVLRQVGLHDVVAKPTGTLSGGEQQRVAVARVLRQEPSLVLADEPVSAVDPRLSDDVLALLCDPSAAWTTVVSLHEPALARRHATRIIGLRSGRVAFDQPAAAVTDDDLADLYRAEPA
ncbi:MAG: ATP-binding cassette domain-containing protein [Acidimicrobiales bacterium]